MVVCNQHFVKHGYCIWIHMYLIFGGCVLGQMGFGT